MVGGTGANGVERPTDKGRDECRAVGGGRAYIVERCHGCGRDLGARSDRRVVERSTDERRCGVVEHLDASGDRTDRDASVTHDAVVGAVDDDPEMNDRDGLGGAVAELGPDPRLGVTECRELDRRDELSWLQDGRTEAGEEVVETHRTFGAVARDDDHRVEREQRRNRVVGRACGGDVAGDRGPVAELWRPDLQAGLGERERNHRKLGMPSDVVVGRECTEPDDAVGDGDPSQFADWGQIEKRHRLARAATVQVEQEVGAAGDRNDRRVVGERDERLRQARKAQNEFDVASRTLHGMERLGRHRESVNPACAPGECGAVQGRGAWCAGSLSSTTSFSTPRSAGSASSLRRRQPPSTGSRGLFALFGAVVPGVDRGIER